MQRHHAVKRVQSPRQLWSHQCPTNGTVLEGIGRKFEFLEQGTQPPDEGFKHTLRTVALTPILPRHKVTSAAVQNGVAELLRLWGAPGAALGHRTAVARHL